MSSVFHFEKLVISQFNLCKALGDEAKMALSHLQRRGIICKKQGVEESKKFGLG